jgi:hypothetical protein
LPCGSSTNADPKACVPSGWNFGKLLTG